MPFNFLRGRQMVIHDARLNNPLTNPPTPLRPPAAMNVWTVAASHSADHILGWGATVAKGESRSDKLDVLHFMAHGFPAGMQIGRDGFGWHNVELFKRLKACIRGSIIFFSCQVGAEQAQHTLSYPLTFGKAVAAYAQCKAIVCKMNQLYSWNGSNVIDFGDFEGVVYVYAPDRDTRMFNYSRKSKLNLELVAFG